MVGPAATGEPHHPGPGTGTGTGTGTGPDTLTNTGPDTLMGTGTGGPALSPPSTRGASRGCGPPKWR
ncbi:hypothetical protein Slala04_75540 [Streptomyces lavendulae subsp. lavendulae]|nr:hypothetical protein Slala04_75540 [Streptomyces lavendulae subsp. lavendulae]